MHATKLKFYSYHEYAMRQVYGQLPSSPARLWIRVGRHVVVQRMRAGAAKSSCWQVNNRPGAGSAEPEICFFHY